MAVDVELLRGPQDGQVLRLSALVQWLEVPLRNEFGLHVVVYRATNRFNPDTGFRLYEFEGVRDLEPQS